eukprot:365581-Chlamydomonas_euryale.AAC.3
MPRTARCKNAPRFRAFDLLSLQQLASRLDLPELAAPGVWAFDPPQRLALHAGAPKTQTRTPAGPPACNSIDRDPL